MALRGTRTRFEPRSRTDLRQIAFEATLRCSGRRGRGEAEPPTRRRRRDGSPRSRSPARELGQDERARLPDDGSVLLDVLENPTGACGCPIRSGLDGRTSRPRTDPSSRGTSRGVARSAQRSPGPPRCSVEAGSSRNRSWIQRSPSADGRRTTSMARRFAHAPRNRVASAVSVARPRRPARRVRPRAGSDVTTSASSRRGRRAPRRRRRRSRRAASRRRRAGRSSGRRCASPS